MSNQTSNNNKRIAKNTIMLYLRMFLTMVVGLYTSRVVLQTLGVEDFGIYNVVGGVVAMMGILNNAMAVASQRYLTFELGKNDINKLKLVFNVNVSIYLLLSFIFILISETIGLWFLNTQLIIPDNRILAANFIYQFSIFSCVAGLMLSPYNASIIAHENMKFFAYVSIGESILRLLVVFMLVLSPIDQLVTYGFLLLMVSCGITLVYYIYCRKNYMECRYSMINDKALFREILTYSSWNIFGSAAGLAKEQGLNVLINMFFNPAINAARGIAYQVNSVVTQFFTSFYTSVRPQITKYYAQKDFDNMLLLVYRSTKLTCFLILLVSLPIIIEAPYIINLWLGSLPEYVVPFVRIIIMISMVDSMANPLMTSAHATGHIRGYQFVVGMMNILLIPLGYIALSMEAEPTIVFVLSLIMSILCFVVRMFIVNRLVCIRIPIYIKSVLIPCLLVTITAFILPFIVHRFIEMGFLRFILVGIMSVISTMFTVIIFGLNSTEKKYVLDIIKQKIHI